MWHIGHITQDASHYTGGSNAAGGWGGEQVGKSDFIVFSATITQNYIMIYRFKYNCTYLTRYKVMIKNRQARLQQYVNCEHPDIQAVFRKGRGSRDQIANICWIIHGVDHFHFSLSCTGEGNGNPFQCSCLENPRDGGAGGLPSMGSHRVRHD